MPLKSPYISPQGAENIKKYKYAGSDSSLLYKHVISPCAQVLVDHVLPEWLAPNTITVMGLGLVFISHGMVYFYCPLMEGEAPSWVYALASLSLVAYQILDVADGKQARKTGNASPLGLLFDHGCDALNVVVSACTFASTLQFGPTWKSVALFACAAIVFFFATWEEYYTGRLDLPIINGPNEGLLIMYTSYAAASIWGTNIWLQDSGLLGLKYNEAFLLGTALGMVSTVLTNALNVIKALPDPKKQIQAVYGLTPSVAFTMLCGGFILVLPSATFQSHPRLILWTVGLIFCKLVMHIMLSHMCHEPLWLLRKTLVTFFATAFLIGTGFLPLTRMEDGIWIFYGLALVPYVHMVYFVVKEMTDILGIQCFVVKPKESKK